MSNNPLFAFCDYIAHVINQAINQDAQQPDSYLSGASGIIFDADDDGRYLSTKKSMIVMDRNGKLYEVIVREV